MANTYDKGDVVRCSGSFTNSAGTAIDPSTITARFKKPSGTITSYVYGVDGQLLRTGTGAYYFDVSITEVGRWYYRFESTGSGQAAEESNFLVEPTRFS